jgi:hypothetical protein
MAPVSEPAVVGSKVTETEQVPPAAIEPAVQLWVVMWKLAPTDTLEMLRFELPLLVTVTVWAAEVAPTAVLGKLRLGGLKAIPGARATPVPDRATV